MNLNQNESFDVHSRETGIAERFGAAMQSPLTTCKLCQGTLQVGFFVDHAHLNQPVVGTWHPGAPVASYWGGGVKTVSLKERQVVAYCCDHCGHIELFARPRETS